MSVANILFELLLMLLLGKILGDIVKRMGFSPLIGQIVAGIILGPMALRLVGLSWELDELSNLGVLFMMFLMGLSVDFEKLMRESVYKASFISLCGGLLTFLSAMTITVLLGFELNTAILVGISFISTSTAIGFMVLNELGDNYSKVYKTIMTVGTTDDIFAMLAFALFNSYMIGGGIDVKSAFVLFLCALGFIIFVLWFGRSISERLISWTVKSSSEISVITVALIIMFMVAYLGENIKVAAVTGAFLAGTILARSPFSYKIITPKIEAISEGFFIPLFFVYTGVRINIDQMFKSTPLNLYAVSIPIDVFLFLGLIMAVMASKYVSTFGAAWLMGGYRRDEMHKMGLAMTPMGEYTLVIGLIGVTTLGAILPGMESVYSVLALIVLFTSILTPIMLKKAYESQ
ncbi:transporter, CPA2 family [Methanocella conradii HZ254]|uniref:Transporter, CPA2 family n=1 Tax=Methanocella conradii (strain DSM 24694 / JCM 17849 / CGMCC 1.5162 / HZ254) TaxID=1041930 RepID=H8I8Z0_METCZ|nr:cation:proton antiporter [Methanocella conradii]AFD00461.1 transporter, CPA2 family [Methanocella conradii HZ254]